MRNGLRPAYRLMRSLVLDPSALASRWRGLPYYLRNALAYRRGASGNFPVTMADLFYTTHERFAPAGTARGHYFHQDLWAARQLYARGVTRHVDVGSRVDGFVAHVLSFCEVDYVDVRPLAARVPGLHVRLGSAVAMPFTDQSVRSLSSLHVIEHIGLGRYGDPVDAMGHLAAAREFVRVLAPGGTLLLGTPVGRERLCFDAHRVFDPQTIVDALSPLRLDSFAIVEDDGDGVLEADFASARRHDYACGLFAFSRPPR